MIFQHPMEKNYTISRRLRTCRMSHFHYLQFRRAVLFHRQHYGRAGVSLATASILKCRNAGLAGIRSVRFRNEQKCQCRNQSGTGRRGHSPVPESHGTGLRYRMSECRCRRHRYWSRCPSMVNYSTYNECRNVEDSFLQGIFSMQWPLKCFAVVSVQCTADHFTNENTREKHGQN